MNLDKIFHLKENHTDVKTEVMAGITTFMTMAYILAVNPNILSASGMDRGAVFTATALSAFIATCLMALLSNYPFVLAPGMGLNAYFTYTVVLGMGYTWQQALAAVFAEGIIFILLSLTNVREAIFNSIPMNLKHAVSVGIGLFIAFIGLQNAKIVVGNDSTLVSIFSFKSSVAEGTFSSQGITVLLALIGVLVTAILLAKNVKGGILWGILITWILGIICQLTHLYVPNADLGYYSLLPDFSNGISVPSMMPTFMKMDFSIVFSLDFVVIMFAFLFVDMFDTLGTLIGVASKADMLDKDGKLPKIKGMRYFHRYHLCRKCLRCCRRRTYRSYFSGSRRTVCAFSSAFPDLSGNSFLCHCTGSDRSWLSDADICYKDRFQRHDRSNPLFHRNHRHAVYVQYFRRYLHGSYLLRCH